MNPEQLNTHMKMRFKQNKAFLSDLLVKETSGKSNMDLMSPKLPYTEDHEAIPLLKGYTHSVFLINYGPDWT